MNDSSIAVRAVRYRVLPGTKAKAHRLNRIAGACRHVWNQMLADQDDLHRLARINGARAPSVTFFTLGKAFAELRNSNGHEWLHELPFAVVRYTLKRQADAWQRFFRGQGGRPKFKGRHGDQGFTIPQDVRVRDGCVAVPKCGDYRLRRHGGNPYADGIAKQAVFKRQGDRWYCTIFYAVEVEPPIDDGTAVGIDRNLGQCALSDGKIVHLPNLDRLEARRRRYQRRMARQVKGGKRRQRTNTKLAATSRRIANVRSNWAHRVSRGIADSFHTVAVEDLATKGMTASAKGTVENPGTNVSAKAGLNRAILASGWGALERNLDYKAGRVVRVNAAHSSQTCNRCGHVDAANRPTQSTFRCQRPIAGPVPRIRSVPAPPSAQGHTDLLWNKRHGRKLPLAFVPQKACGHAANADVNAARNIMASGIGATGRRGALALATPVTRQTGGGVPRAA